MMSIVSQVYVVGKQTFQRFMVILVLAFFMLLATGVALAATGEEDAVIVGQATYSDIVTAIEFRLKWLIANPNTEPGIDPSAPYRDILILIERLKALNDDADDLVVIAKNNPK